MSQTITIIFEGIDKYTKKARAVKRITEKISGATRSLTTEVNKGKKGLDNWSQSQKQVTKGFKSFRMELLGTMFFGMMIQKMFLDLSRTATAAFMKITEGQTESGQAITRLSAAFQFLQFTIGDALGQALLPYLDTIVGIIESVADWVEQNPRLVAGIMGVGIALGTILFAVGSFGLGLASVSQLLGVGSGQGLIGSLQALPLPAKLAAIAMVAGAVVIAANWDALGSGIKKVAGVIGKEMFNIETDAFEMSQKWDDALETMAEGTTVIFIRIAKMFAAGFTAILNLQQSFIRQLTVRMATALGADPKEASRAASLQFPTIEPPREFLKFINDMEKDLLENINGITTPPTFPGIVPRSPFEPGMSMADVSFPTDVPKSSFGGMSMNSGEALNALNDIKDNTASSSGVTVGEVNIHISTPEELKLGAIETGTAVGEAFKETFSNFGGTIQIGGGTGQ